MICQNILLFTLLFNARVFSFAGSDKVLLRTKRLPEDDNDDYITSFQMIRHDEHIHGPPIRTERFINEEHSIAEDELSNIFRNIVQKREITSKEDFSQLKQFFTDIRKKELIKRSNEEKDGKIIPVHENMKMKNGSSDAEQLGSKRSVNVEMAGGEGEAMVVGDEDQSGSGSSTSATDGDESGSAASNVPERDLIDGADDDYSSLFTKVVQRRSVNSNNEGEDSDEEEKHIVKRNVLNDDDDDDEEENYFRDFEGLPETLAVKDISRQNPRVMILKREARNLPDIPLPFNNIKSSSKIKEAGSQISRIKKSVNEPINQTPVQHAHSTIYNANASVGLDDYTRRTRSTKSTREENRNLLYSDVAPLKELKIIDDEKANSLFDHDEKKSLHLTMKNNGVYYDTRNKRFLITTDVESFYVGNQTERKKRSINDTDNNTTQKKSIETENNMKIKKREVYYDDDPDIERKMNRVDQDKLEKAIAAIKKAKSVYRFARDVVDIVDKKRSKNKLETPILQGVWSGLGTSPEFVPGMTKTLKDDVKDRIQQKSRKISKEELAEIRQKRRINIEPGFYNSVNRTVRQTTDSADSTSKEETADDGTFNNYQVLMKHIAEKSNIEKLKEKIEPKAIEIGNLGSVHFADKRDSISQVSIHKAKRQIPEAEININHMTPPTYDGKVVFAFDEIKELVPVKTISSKEEETRLEPLQSREASTLSSYDVDKDLAEGMVVSKDSVPPRPLSSNLLATYVEYTKNEKRSKQENKSRDEPSLLKKEGKLGHAQIAQYKTEQAGPRLEQMKKWAGETLSKPYVNMVETSDRTAEAEAELQKLNLDSLNLTSYEPYISKEGETDSEYLAKSLQQRNEERADKDIALDELHKKIIEEQQRYKIYIEQLKKEQAQLRKSDDFETQTKTSHDLGKQLNTTILTLSTVATTTTPTNVREGDLEHFERIHGYNLLPNTTFAPYTSTTMAPEVMMTGTPTQSTLSTTIINTPMSTALKDTTKSTSTTTMPTTTYLSTILATTTTSSKIQNSTSMPTANPINAENMPIVIPVIEPANLSNKSDASLYSVNPVNEVKNPMQINNSYTQKLPLARTVGGGDATSKITTANTQPPITGQTVLPYNNSTLPFPMDIAYQPHAMAPRNVTNFTEMVPGVDGYVGCFIDRLVDGRDLPIRAGLPFVTPNNCRSICKKTGYKYAGVQYGYLCFCGNMYGKYDNVPDSECNTVCSGDDRYTCGGLWRNKIYDTESVEDMELNSARQYQDHIGATRSFIPYVPPSQTRDELENAERKDFNALQEEVNEAMQRAGERNEMRTINNFTDDYWLQLAQKQFPVEEQPIHDTPQEEKNNELTGKFVYMHSQENQRELKQSEPREVSLVPGTRLYRCEIKLLQLWYDDFAIQESTKYKILTGNVENAVKNLFINDTSFILTEVIALKESDPQMPHRTEVEFIVVFKENGTTTEGVTHRMFESVKHSKKLDDMPVLPNTLKVREYLSTRNPEEYINQARGNTASQQNSTAEPASQLNEASLHELHVQNKPEQTSSGITELKNYIATQTNSEVADRRSQIQQPDKTAIRRNGDEDKNKPPYLLRMFFWKDMLARKKRNIDNKVKESIVNKVVSFDKTKPILLVRGGEVPIIRSKRSQADEWPISYKGDAMKKSYNKRKRDNGKNLKDSLQGDNEKYDATRRSEIFKKLTAIQDTNNEKENAKLSEEILHRTKRTEEEEYN